MPVLPSASAALESDFDIISADDCSSNSDSDIFERLEKDLIEQLKVKIKIKLKILDYKLNCFMLKLNFFIGTKNANKVL